jgi:hypothetical protein
MADEQGTGARLIIPAPSVTQQEAEISWYEVRLLGADDDAGDYSHLPKGRKRVASSTTEIDADDGLKAVFTSPEGRQLTIGATVEGDRKSGIRIQADINGREIEITGQPDDPQSAKVSRSESSFSPEELTIINQWARLAQPLNSLAQATRQSWGCGSCVLLGAGVLVGAGCCAEGNPGCCAGALVGGGTFVEHCHGACASSGVTAVVEAQTFVEF